MVSQLNIRSRLIEERDLDEVAVLLGRGLGYPREYFSQVFERLRSHRTPDGFPKFGLALTNCGRIVGVVVLIFTQHKTGSSTTRCHVTSWYVEPEFRTFATMFLGHAL